MDSLLPTPPDYVVPPMPPEWFARAAKQAPPIEITARPDLPRSKCGKLFWIPNCLEICIRRAEVQAGWTDSQRRRRTVEVCDPVVLPVLDHPIAVRPIPPL